jgi:hypothetical protein
MADIHDGSHFMKNDELTQWLSLINSRNYVQALPYLRQLWMVHADESFFKKFLLVHWVPYDKLDYWLDKRLSTIELCCKGYLAPPYSCWFHGTIGLLIQGEVVLAGNSDLQSNQWSGLFNKDGKQYTEYASYLFVNKKTCKTPFEFVVQKWKPIGLVLDEASLAKESNRALVTTLITVSKSVAQQKSWQILNEHGDRISF